MLFLEDVRNVQARSRQEKLAAMGRVSAGIAHEIRNPLAAIAQANALLAEDATDPAQRQLTRMVTDNVERLKRIVDDVMEVAPGAAPEPRRDRRHRAGRRGLRRVGARRAASRSARDSRAAASTCRREPLGVVFDAEHLRRVLVNLLDNARRHASDAPGAIARAARRARDEPRARAQRGRATARRSRPTSSAICSSRSSRRAAAAPGLGLYICRELCERYGASIDYRLLPPEAAAPQRVLRRHAAAPPLATDRSRDCTSTP